MTANTIQPFKARPVLFSLLTLLSGIVIGAGATLIIVGLPQKEPAPPPPENFSRRIVQRMTRELGLTAEQQKAIQTVMETHMTVIDQYRDEARPKIRQEIDTMNNEILALLDVNQQQMWKDSIERMQQRFREMRQRRGPGGPGGPRRNDDQRQGDRRGRDGADRGDRFRRGERPGRDPNSPFFRRRRFGSDMEPGAMPMPPDMQAPPDDRRPGMPGDPNLMPV